MQLTPQQIASFERDGFLILRAFTNEKTCDDIHNVALKHLHEMIEPIESEEEYLQSSSGTKTTRRLRQVYDRDPIFTKWMRNAEMLPILKQLSAAYGVVACCSRIFLKTSSDSAYSPSAS